MKQDRARRPVLPAIGLAVCVLVSLVLAVSDRPESMPLAFVLLVPTVFFHVIDTRVTGRLLLPHSVIILVWELFYFGGVIIYVLREHYLYNLPCDIGSIFDVGLCMIIGLWTGRFLWLIAHRTPRKPPATTPRRDSHQVDRTRLIIVIILLTLMSYAGAYLAFGQTGIIPLASPDVDAARVQVSRMASGFALPLIMLGIIALTLAYRYLAVLGSRTPVQLLVVCLAAVATLPPLIMYGGRFFIVLPMFILVLLWYWKRQRRFGAVRLTLAAAFAVCVVAILGLWRSGEESVGSGIARGLLNDLFSEVRMLGTAKLYMPTEGVGKKLLLTVLSGFLPENAANWLGVDKAQFWDPIGGQILAALPSFQGYEILGLRVTVVGEIYLGFGLAGVFFLSAVAAVCGGWLDRLLDEGGKRYLHTAVLMTALISALMPYGTVFFLTLATMGVPGLLAVWFITASHRPERIRTQRPATGRQRGGHVAGPSTGGINTGLDRRVDDGAQECRIHPHEGTPLRFRPSNRC